MKPSFMSFSPIIVGLSSISKKVKKNKNDGFKIFVMKIDRKLLRNENGIKIKRNGNVELL